MSSCNHCELEKDCHYPYKPCDCVHHRKFWDEQRRKEFDKIKSCHLPETQKPCYRPHGGGCRDLHCEYFY